MTRLTGSRRSRDQQHFSRSSRAAWEAWRDLIVKQYRDEAGLDFCLDRLLS
ncbi:hypothetical protein ABZ215_10775 [Amycolatopsis sp. NPDC006131]|uniref:hypothetical protein n=1 Tax=Amycolatopsis sp. NPDC006131 TaxID=3156731 RepID=UPI0033BD8CE6